MGDDGDDGAALGLLAGDLEEEGDAFAIEPGGRLIEEQERGAREQGTREGDALALATAHGADRALGEGAEAKTLGERADGVGRETVETRYPGEVLDAR